MTRFGQTVPAMLLLHLAFVVAVVSSVKAAAVSDPYKLPEGTLIGAGVSALQTEGAWNTSGKGESQADHLFHLGTLNFPATPDVAADSYGKFAEDIAMAKQLKLQVYRFSLSWSRLLPTANISDPNYSAITHYNAVIDEIIKNDMQPMVTLYHFDHPQILQKEFLGWENVTMASKFEEYADFAFNKFGEKVKLWATINEPNYYCMYFNSLFVQAGVAKEEQLDSMRCMHNFVLAHAKAYRLYERKYRAVQQGQVGMSFVFFHAQPSSNSPEDIYAADVFNEMQAGLVMHPIIYGDYPAVAKKVVPSLPEFQEEEKLQLQNSTDFVGVNVYSGVRVSYTTNASATVSPVFGSVLKGIDFIQFDTPIVDFSSINPDVIRRATVWTWQRYGKPIVISENGYGGNPTEGVHDHKRAVYHSAYMRSLVAAVNEFDIDLLAYIAWSLIDSFEWSAGYSRPFGLVHVDYEGKTLARSLKDSSSFFIELADKRTVPLVSSATPAALAPAAVLTALMLWIGSHGSF